MRLLVLGSMMLTACGSGSSEADREQAEFEARAAQIEAKARSLEGAPASAAKSALDEQIAGVLNLNGLLCARVVNVSPLQVRPNTYEVTCIEYRGGSGTVHYILDAGNGTAVKA